MQRRACRPASGQCPYQLSRSRYVPLPVLARVRSQVQAGTVTVPPEPTADEPVWESVSISGSFPLVSDEGEDDGSAGDREPLNPRDVPPELAAEAER